MVIQMFDKQLFHISTNGKRGPLSDYRCLTPIAYDARSISGLPNNEKKYKVGEVAGKNPFCS